MSGNFGFLEIDDKEAQEVTKRLMKQEDPDAKRSKYLKTPYIKIKSGTEYTFRVLPPSTNTGPYAYQHYIEIGQHWNLESPTYAPGKNIPLLCPKRTKHHEHGKGSCYICDQVKALFDSGDSDDETRARELNARRSFVYQVIDRDDPVWTGGETDLGIDDFPEKVGLPKVKFLQIPYMAHKQLGDYLTDSHYNTFYHPLRGYDIRLKRTGTGGTTQYRILLDTKETKIFDDDTMMAQCAEEMFQIHEHPNYRIPSYDETRARFLGEEFDYRKEEEYQLKAGTGSAPALPGYSAPAPNTSPNKDKYATWVSLTDGFKIESVSEIAATMDCDESDVPSCYTVEPDHLDESCLGCEAKGQCATAFAAKNGGRRSINAPAVPSGGFGKGSGKGSAANSGPDDNDIPF